MSTKGKMITSISKEIEREFGNQALTERKNLMKRHTLFIQDSYS